MRRRAPNPLGPLCWCGCKSSIADARAGTKWASAACSTAWSRANPGKGRRDAANPNVARTRRRSGPQISYHKAVKAMTLLLCRVDPDLAAAPNFVEHVVEAALLEALPARQRERLEGKRS